MESIHTYRFFLRYNYFRLLTGVKYPKYVHSCTNVNIRIRNIKILYKLSLTDHNLKTIKKYTKYLSYNYVYVKDIASIDEEKQIYIGNHIKYSTLIIDNEYGSKGINPGQIIVSIIKKVSLLLNMRRPAIIKTAFNVFGYLAFLTQFELFFEKLPVTFYYHTNTPDIFLSDTEVDVNSGNISQLGLEKRLHYIITTSKGDNEVYAYFRKNSKNSPDINNAIIQYIILSDDCKDVRISPHADIVELRYIRDIVDDSLISTILDETCEEKNPEERIKQMSVDMPDDKRYECTLVSDVNDGTVFGAYSTKFSTPKEITKKIRLYQEDTKKRIYITSLTNLIAIDMSDIYEKFININMYYSTLKREYLEKILREYPSKYMSINVKVSSLKDIDELPDLKELENKYYTYSMY